MRGRLIAKIFRKKKPGEKRIPAGTILKILEYYRGKNSLMFLLKWTLWKVPEEPPQGFSISGLIHKAGLWDDHKHQLWGIYLGLEQEIGTGRAMLAVLEIIDKRNDQARIRG